MPRINLSDVGVDPVLTNLSVMHTQSVEGFVHHQVFPVVPIDVETATYFVFNRSDTLRVDAQQRRPGTEAARKTLGLQERGLELVQWALEMSLPDEIRASRDSPLSNEEPLVRALTMDLMMRRELEWVAAYVNAAANPWSNPVQTGVPASPSGPQFLQFDLAAAQPIETIKRWIRLVQLACGVKPNILVMDIDTFDVISENANVLSRLEDTRLRDVTRQTIAALCGLDDVLVAEAIHNTAPEDADGQDYTGTRVFPRATALLAYRTPSPQLLEASAGYVFSWTAFDQVRGDIGSSGAAAIQRYRDEVRMSDVLRAMAHYDHNVVTPSAALIATATIA